MYFALFDSFMAASAIRISIILGERFNNLSILTDFRSLVKNSRRQNGQELSMDWSKIVVVRKSLNILVRGADILFKLTQVFLGLLLSGLYLIGMLKSDSFLVQINYAMEFLSMLIVVYYSCTSLYVFLLACFVFKYINLRCIQFNESINFIKMYLQWFDQHKSKKQSRLAERMEFLDKKLQNLMKDHSDIVNRIRNYDKSFKFILGTAEYALAPVICSFMLISFLEEIHPLMSILMKLLVIVLMFIQSAFIHYTSTVSTSVTLPYGLLNSIQFGSKNIRLKSSGKRSLLNLMEGMVSNQKPIGLTCFGLFTYKSDSLAWMYFSIGMFYMTLNGFVGKL